MKDFLLQNWVQLSTTIGIVIAWVIDRKKRKIETETSAATLTDNISSIYKKLIDDTDKKFAELKNEIAELQKEIDVITEEREQLRKKNKEQEVKIQQLEQKVYSLQKELSQYKKDIL